MKHLYLNIYNNLVKLTRNKLLYSKTSCEDTFSIRLLIFLFHLAGTFDFLELKMYDFKFGVRDSLYSVDRKNLDVAIVYSDDESYRLLTKKFSYPYPRGDVWAKAVENIASLGAKVIVLI